MKAEEEFYNNLRHGGKWLYRHNLIIYDELFDEIDFAWNYWYLWQKFICRLKGHRPGKLYRCARDGETPLPDMAGCVFSHTECLRCHKTLQTVI